MTGILGRTYATEKPTSFNKRASVAEVLPYWALGRQVPRVSAASLVSCFRSWSAWSRHIMRSDRASMDQSNLRVRPRGRSQDFRRPHRLPRPSDGTSDEQD